MYVSISCRFFFGCFFLASQQTYPKNNVVYYGTDTVRICRCFKVELGRYSPRRLHPRSALCGMLRSSTFEEVRSKCQKQQNSAGN